MNRKNRAGLAVLIVIVVLMAAQIACEQGDGGITYDAQATNAAAIETAIILNATDVYKTVVAMPTATPER